MQQYHEEWQVHFSRMHRVSLCHVSWRTINQTFEYRTKRNQRQARSWYTIKDIHEKASAHRTATSFWTTRTEQTTNYDPIRHLSITSEQVKRLTTRQQLSSIRAVLTTGLDMVMLILTRVLRDLKTRTAKLANRINLRRRTWSRSCVRQAW